MIRTFHIADLFCGGGGSSSGALKAVRALGAEMDLISVNHWDVAIATHTRNFPTARHLGEAAGQEPRVHDVDEPLPAGTGHGAGALVSPTLAPTDDAPRLDPRRLVWLDGQLYLLDIRFRMLTNRELARAMGFDDDEVDYEFVGTAEQVTKQIGNAVCVNLAAALVRAIREGVE